MATRKPAAKTAAGKKTAAANASQEYAKVQLPAGFAPVMNGEFGEEWEYTATPLLVGAIVGEIRSMVVGKGRSAHETKVVNVANDEDGVIYAVWESAALRGWFEAIGKVPEGTRVAVAFQGYRDVGKPEPMKVFVGSIEEGAVPAAPKSHAKRDAKTAEARPPVKRAPAKK